MTARTMASCIYRGTVRHRRFEPKAHDFRFSMFMLYLDLDELDTVFSCTRFFKQERTAPASFRRADYIGDPDTPIRDVVRERVRNATGQSPAGPIRMLTHIRYFGYCFNPVSFYYCFDESGTRVEHVVAEITNTPWGERHAYVINSDDTTNNVRRTFDKDFHVSPFMPMDLTYDWRFGQPARRLGVHMKLRKEGRDVFDATLALERTDITPASLRATLVRYPLMTAQVIAGIHFQALRLWMKRIPVCPHPRTAARSNAPSMETEPR